MRAVGDGLFFSVEAFGAKNRAQQARTGADVTPHHHILNSRHFGKQPNVLKRAGNARLGHLVHRSGPVGFASQLKVAAVRGVKTGEHIEKCGLAGAIGANQAINLATLDLDAHIAQGLQSTKSFGDAGDVQYGVAHVQPFVLCSDLPCSGEGHRPRGRISMMVIMAKPINNWRKMDASSRPSVMACNGPAT